MSAILPYRRELEAHKFKLRQGLKDEWNAKRGENLAKLSSKRALNGSQVSCRQKNEAIKIYANKSGAYPVDPYAAQFIGEDGGTALICA